MHSVQVDLNDSPSMKEDSPARKTQQHRMAAQLKLTPSLALHHPYTTQHRPSCHPCCCLTTNCGLLWQSPLLDEWRWPISSHP